MPSISLQSRLATSLPSSLMSLVACVLFAIPRAALATEVLHLRETNLDVSPNAIPGLELSYEPDFALFDRSIIGRAPEGLTALRNNIPERLDLPRGETRCYMIDQSVTSGNNDRNRVRDLGLNQDDDDENLERSLARRQTSSPVTVYVSANTCSQPDRVSREASSEEPPQLTLSVSESDDGCAANPADLPANQRALFNEGLATLTINVTGDVYIGITAPNVTEDGYSGFWNYQVAISTDDYYHRYWGNDTGELQFMDSDSTSALLVSRNITENEDDSNEVMTRDMPYELFVENSSSRRFEGLRHSVCGLETAAEIWATRNGEGRLNNLVRMNLTTRGPGGFPKQQFFFDRLNASSSYTGILVKLPSSLNRRQEGGTVGGGGTVYNSTTFETRSEANCRVVTDLEFCNETQYAVPGNEDRFDSSALARRYDDYARRMYANFETVMMQVACEAPTEERYSLARNCSDCRVAYKQWLCSVSIPRCEDFTSSNPFAVARNVGQEFPNSTSLADDMRDTLVLDRYTNTSRNAFIDEEIQPGPYKEVLPCEDICYEVVRSCPAVIGFTCPRPGWVGFATSYGRREESGTDMSCNFPGEARRTVSPSGAAPMMLNAGALAVPLIAGLVLGFTS